MSDETTPAIDSSTQPAGNQPSTIQGEMLRLRHNYDANLLVIHSLKKLSESDWDQIQAKFAWQPLSNAILPYSKLTGAARASVLGGFFNTTLSILGNLSSAVIGIAARKRGETPPRIEGKEAQTRWLPELEKAWGDTLPFREVWQSLLSLALLATGGLPKDLHTLSLSLCRPVGTPPDGTEPSTNMQFGITTLQLPTNAPDNIPVDLIHLAYFSACVLAQEVARWLEQNKI